MLENCGYLRDNSVIGVQRCVQKFRKNIATSVFVSWNSSLDTSALTSVMNYIELTFARLQFGKV